MDLKGTYMVSECELCKLEIFLPESFNFMLMRCSLLGSFLLLWNFPSFNDMLTPMSGEALLGVDSDGVDGWLLCWTYSGCIVLLWFSTGFYDGVSIKIRKTSDDF